MALNSLADVDYLLRGLRQELEAGLARLGRTDAVNDHVQWYRQAFEQHEKKLRAALRSAGPEAIDVAYYALQTAFLGGIWEVLKRHRAARRAVEDVAAKNTAKKSSAALRRQRCLAIVGEMSRPTASNVQRRYAVQFPTEPTPNVKTIRAYLKK